MQCSLADPVGEDAPEDEYRRDAGLYCKEVFLQSGEIEQARGWRAKHGDHDEHHQAPVYLRLAEAMATAMPVMTTRPARMAPAIRSRMCVADLRWDINFTCASRAELRYLAQSMAGFRERGGVLCGPAVPEPNAWGGG
ncbi:MAG: hypothetical protein JSS24_13260 [Proteobacteria bacterium]|nr:hypothetical protein [Pseudomonadota bacterium]